MDFSTLVAGKVLIKSAESGKWMQRQILSTPSAAPFVKWAGGKTQLLPKIGTFVPQFTRYFEPFLGGGALFFHLASRTRFGARLCDANRELVNAYNMVKNDVENLIVYLDKHERGYRKAPVKYYYWLRSAQPEDNLESAARFIALNKTCYNGLYRVNRRGAFNVPMGRYRNPTICDRKQLRKASAVLNYCDTKIVACDYKQVLKGARDGDFIYIDPPFNPMSATAHFVDYTQNGFGEQDQIELAQTFRELDRKGCKVLLSNSDTKLTRDLYSGFERRKVRVLRAISCKGSARKGYGEIVVSNYTV